MSFAPARSPNPSPDKRRFVMERPASKQQTRIPRRPDRTRPAPLSYAQQRFWFLQQFDPASAQYNLPFAARIDGPLDTGILERCLTEVVRRHESLRTTFAAVEGKPMQFVAAPREFELAVTQAADAEDVAARMHAHASEPFDL